MHVTRHSRSCDYQGAVETLRRQVWAQPPHTEEANPPYWTTERPATFWLLFQLTEMVNCLLGSNDLVHLRRTVHIREEAWQNSGRCLPESDKRINAFTSGKCHWSRIVSIESVPRLKCSLPSVPTAPRCQVCCTRPGRKSRVLGPHSGPGWAFCQESWATSCWQGCGVASLSVISNEPSSTITRRATPERAKACLPAQDVAILEVYFAQPDGRFHCRLIF